MRFLHVCLGAVALLAKQIGADETSSKGKSPIEHVVVLMLENRSFDHVLGFFKSKNEKIDGLKGSESQPLNCSDPHAKRFKVNARAGWVSADPDHGYTANLEHIFGGGPQVYPPPMNGFVENAFYNHFNKNLTEALGVISSFDPAHIPTMSTLIEEFALFQKWFPSVPSSTWPNRLFTHSSTSHGSTSTSDYLNMILGYPQKTLYDVLDENKLSWLSFFSEIPDQLLFQSGRKLENLGKLRPYFEFKSTVQKGKLPNFSWIAPKYFELPCIAPDDQHPPHDFSLGELRVKEVYEILRSGPQWNKTALIIMYDENGGFADHVPTPMKGIPSPDDITDKQTGFKFNRLGVRVPTIVVSPWIDKHTLVDEPTRIQKQTKTSRWDHTSLIATVRALFNISQPLTKRDAWAARFDNLFRMRDTPRTDCPLTLPAPPKNLFYHPTGELLLTDLHRDIFKIIAGAAGMAESEIPHHKLRNELDGGRWVLQTLYEKILKREIPTPLKAAMELGISHAHALCESVDNLIAIEQEKELDASVYGGDDEIIDLDGNPFVQSL